jgi:hypothetical protein
MVKSTLAVNGFLAGERLPPLDGDINVTGINLCTIGNTAHVLSSEQRRSGSKKSVEDQITLAGDIQNGIG